MSRQWCKGSEDIGGAYTRRDAEFRRARQTRPQAGTGTPAASPHHDARTQRATRRAQPCGRADCRRPAGNHATREELAERRTRISRCPTTSGSHPGTRSAPHDALALDKDADWIEEHIAAPRREGRDIFIDGQVFSWDSIDQIRITETDQTSEQLLPQIRARRQSDPVWHRIPDRWYVARDGRDVTEQFITGPPGTGPRTDASKATTFAGNRKAVMVIYGHDKQANDACSPGSAPSGCSPANGASSSRPAAAPAPSSARCSKEHCGTSRPSSRSSPPRVRHCRSAR